MTEQPHSSNSVQPEHDARRDVCACMAAARQRARLEALALDVLANCTRHEEPEEWRQ